MHPACGVSRHALAVLLLASLRLPGWAQIVGETTRHAPADRSAPYWSVRCSLPAPVGEDGFAVLRTGPGQTCTFVLATGGDESALTWICRAPQAPPAELRVEGATGRLAVLSADWSAAREDASLPDRWLKAVQAHFKRLDAQDVLESFSEFVVARLEEKKPDAGLRDDAARRRRQAAALDLIAGRTAIEESLQLDRFRGTGRRRDQEAKVALASIEGVKIASHPWEEMLKGRKPESHAIERFLPLDQYAFEAASLGAFLEATTLADELLSPLLQVASSSARDEETKGRLERQLCLPASALAKTLGPLVVGRVALTGGDPYLREGSDVTMVFELKSPEAFLANLEARRLAAQGSSAGARRVEAEHGGHKIAGLVSPERTVSSYSTVLDGHALVSNSLAGLRRALDAADGKIESQDDGLDRRFVRTLLARTAEESAFLFLSDPFIRRLVGPGLRLRESRRLECSASLRSMAHAAAWRRLRGETRAAGELKTLIGDGDLPESLLLCPDGGEYRLVDGGRAGACSVHGTLEYLTPNAELVLESVTEEEKAAYDDFRNRYQSYWTRYFDPIGVQVRLGETKSLETVVLPLIQLSEYREWSTLFGGEGRQSGALPEAASSPALLASAHLNRESELFQSAENLARSFVFQGAQQAALAWVGDRVSVFIEDAPTGFRGADLDDPVGGMLQMLGRGLGGGLRVAVKNQLLLAGFLGAVKSMILSASGSAVVFETLPERQGVSLIKVSSKEGSGGHGPDAVYYGIIGDGLYLAFRKESLDAIIDRRGAAAEAPVAPGWIDGSHLGLELNWAAAPRWRALLGELHAREARSRCERSVRALHELEALGSSDPTARRDLDGGIACCPAAGTIAARPDGSIACSVHGGAEGSKPMTPLDRWQRLRARLEFSADGLRAALEAKQ